MLLPSALLLLMWSAAVAAQTQRIVEGPVDTKIISGETAVLKCRVEAQKGAVQWVKGGFGLGYDRQLPAAPRYTMEGSSALGEFHLKIRDVQLEDDDEYQCQVGATVTDPVRKSAKAKLTVLVTPALPRLVNMRESVRGVAGRQMTVACVSEGGKPPATVKWGLARSKDATDGPDVVRWLDADGANPPHLPPRPEALGDGINSGAYATVNSSTKKEGAHFTVRSVLSFAPQPADDDLFLVCSAHHDTYNKPQATSVKLILEYAPKVSVTINSSSKLREGDRALLSCVVDAKPIESVQIIWKKDGAVIRGAKTDTLPLTELRREHNNSKFECEATNSVGRGNGALVLDIKFGPQILSSDQTKAVDIGDSVTFSCMAVGNPKPTIKWTKVGAPEDVLSDSENFTINAVQGWQRGEYQCTAMVADFQPAILKSMLHIQGPPAVSVVERLYAARETTVQIKCEVRGFPRPNDISWYRGGVLLDIARLGGRYDVRQSPRNYGVESILTVKDLHQSDFNVFNCTATNARGMHSMEMHLIPIDPIPMYLVIPGIICICVLILLFILVILLKRRNMCGSKSSKYSDDHSDVTVKVETLDGQYYPDMYTAPLENGDLICTKDYISIPQDNPDLDFLPPPTYSTAHGYRGVNGYGPTNSAGYGAAAMGNGNGPIQYLIDHGHNDVEYITSPYESFRPEPSYGSFVSASTGAPMYSHDRITFSNAPSGSVVNDPGLYYPSDMAPLAPLETLQELPTPETEAATPLLAGHSLSHGQSPMVHRRSDDRRSPNDRPASRTSTHV